MERTNAASPWSGSQRRSTSNNNKEPKHAQPNLGCRSSAIHVSLVMGKFGETKRQLVRSIGFGGLLELHDMNRVSRYFSHWLLSNTNWEYNVISVRDDLRLKIVSQDIEKITGLSASGRDVLSTSLTEEDKPAFFAKHLSFLGDQQTMLATADKMVQQELPRNMTPKDAAEFKVAFVVFIMGRFLAPTNDINTVHSNFWNAVVKPDEIKDYNWSAYVLSCLMDSARILLFSNLINKPVSSIIGCPLLLQIFYLDNIDLGQLNLKHDVFPRIKAFNCNLLGKMIQADTDKATGAYGCSKLRPREESCYALPDTCEVTLQTIATLPEIPRTTPSYKKRPFVACSGAASPTISQEHGFFDYSPIINRSGTPDFPAYVRTKYPDHVHDLFVEDLRYHNAKCIQLINKNKNALVNSLVAENMSLVDKYIQRIDNQNGSGIPKYPKKANQNNRRSYDDLLSGPESGSEAEDQQRIHKGVHRGFKNVMPNLLNNNNKNVGSELENREGRSPFNLFTDTTMLCFSDNDGNDNQAIYPTDTGSLGKQDPPIREFNNVMSTETTQKGKQKMSDHGTAPGGSSNASVSEFSDVCYHTPAAVSKMCPLSPEISPTTANKLHSDHAVSVRMLTSILDMDLNTRTVDAEYNRSPVVKKTVKVGRFAKSHWSLGADHPERDSSVTNILFDWLSTTNSDELQRSWIMHDAPRFIECKGLDLKKEFFTDSGVTYDLFDICVRRLQQLDRFIYRADIPLRWRFFFESDFSMLALAGEVTFNTISIREQLIGPAVDYEVQRCRMIMVPVQSRGFWWFYAIDQKDHILFIIDATMGNKSQTQVIAKHSGTISIILDYLKATINSLFDGWKINVNSFETVVVTSSTACQRAESAFYTLYCMKNFDGNVNIHVTQNTISKFKQQLLYELFGLKDNRGSLPSVYVETIDD